MPSRLLSQAAALFGAKAGEVFVEFGMHRYQFAILATLEAFGPSSQADLGRRTDLDRSDVTATLTSLENDGLVARDVDPLSRRQKLVTLTESGRARYGALNLAQRTLQDELLEALPARDRVAFVRSLQTLIDALSK
jgi:DNA-binding MarR family transcriptional regulator